MKARQCLQGLAFLAPVLLASASLLVVDGSGGGLFGSPARAAGETPQDELAAQIRLQGFACDRSLGASEGQEALEAGLRRLGSQMQ